MCVVFNLLKNVNSEARARAHSLSLPLSFSPSLSLTRSLAISLSRTPFDDALGKSKGSNKPLTCCWHAQ